MSRRMIIQALVVTALLALLPGIYFFDKLGPDHELDKTLKEMGFLPVNPPSNLLGIDSLFHVDPKEFFGRSAAPIPPTSRRSWSIRPASRCWPTCSKGEPTRST